MGEVYTPKNPHTEVFAPPKEYNVIGKTGPDTPKDGEIGQPPRAIKPTIPTVPVGPPNQVYTTKKGNSSPRGRDESQPIARS